MIRHLRSVLWMTALTTLLVSCVYPAVLLLIGQAAFPRQANGSLILDRNGKPIGSRLIAQPFTGDRYFQPRPSAASYNGAASGASNWGASNYKLRDRVARQIGPIVKYRSGTKKGRPVGPDIESWFQADRYQGQGGIVARWAQAHPGLAAGWVTVDGRLKEGTDIQAVFFDMWLQDHPEAELEPVPADMVMASGSGLDPHITLKSALYQLDRVAGAWAEATKADPARVRKEIEGLLEEKAEAPLGGLAGVDLINVLEMNVALRERYGPAPGTDR